MTSPKGMARLEGAHTQCSIHLAQPILDPPTSKPFLLASPCNAKGQREVLAFVLWCELVKGNLVWEERVHDGTECKAI